MISLQTPSSPRCCTPPWWTVLLSRPSWRPPSSAVVGTPQGAEGRCRRSPRCRSLPATASGHSVLRWNRPFMSFLHLFVLVDWWRLPQSITIFFHHLDEELDIYRSDQTCQTGALCPKGTTCKLFTLGNTLKDPCFFFSASVSEEYGRRASATTELLEMR